MKYVMINNYISKVYADFYINYLKNKITLNKKTCFDIGSSSGSFVNELNKIGNYAEGIESDIWKIQSPKVRHHTFNLEYKVDKKYHMITLLQVIYFLGEVEDVLLKLKTMLNPNGVIFIVTSPYCPETYKYDLKSYKCPSKETYYEICSRLGFKILDYSIFQSDIGVSFINGKLKAILRLLAFRFGLRKPIKIMSDGNLVFILMRLDDN